MGRFYSTLLAIPLAVACGKFGDPAKITDKKDSVQSVDVIADTLYQSAAFPGDITKNPCKGPPSITHLFESYQISRERLNCSPNASHSPVKRVYNVAEAEMQRARQMLSLCEQNRSFPVAGFYYDSANQFAISAIAWILEAEIRAEEPIIFRTNTAK